MRNALAVIIGIIILIMPTQSFSGSCGDVNNDGAVNIFDITYLITYLYLDGPEPDCGYETGTATDIDGNVYRTVKIGDQWWMAENLRVTHYRNGDPITKVTDPEVWYLLETEAYCEYDNDTCNSLVYGKLYNWHAVKDSRNLAPEGWHVPTHGEWLTLIDYLCGNAVAGGKLKEAGLLHWLSPNTDATNESGFTGLPGGTRTPYGTYGQWLTHAFFWTSTQSGYIPENGIARVLLYNGAGVSESGTNKSRGCSIRCVKD